MAMSTTDIIAAMKAMTWKDGLQDLIASHGDQVMADGGVPLLSVRDGVIASICKGYSLPNLKALVSWIGIDHFTVIDSSGYAPVHYVCMHSSSTNAAYLFDNLPTSALTLKTRFGDTPMDLSITFKRSDTVALLHRLSLSAQDTITPSAMGKKNVVHFMCRYGSPDNLKAIVDTLSLKDFLDTDMFGQLPIDMVCMRGNSTVLKVLLSKWTVDDLCLTATDQQSLMSFAWSSGDLNTVKLLVQHVPQQHCIAQGRDGSVLHKVAATRKTAILSALVNNATPDQLVIRDRQGRTALHVACAGNRITPISILLSRWPDDAWRVQDNDGNSLLHAAVSARQYGTLMALIDRMGDQFLPLIKNNRGQTILHLLARGLGNQCVPRIVGLVPSSCLYDVDNDGKAPLDTVAKFYMHLWLPKVKSAAT